MESSFALGALFLSILAMLIDLKTSKVPNWLTGGGLIVGFGARTCLMGAAGLEGALGGGRSSEAESSSSPFWYAASVEAT